MSDIQEAQLGEVIESIPEPIKENIMTTYSRLREKWKTEGQLEGKLEGKAEVVLNLFDEGFETARIAKFVKLREEDVASILKNNGKLN